jgi:WD40 repeat protein
MSFTAVSKSLAAPLAAILLLCGCGADPAPIASDPPLLKAEKAASFSDAAAPAREALFGPDGKALVTTSASGTVAIRRLPDFRVSHRFHHDGGATSAAFAGAGRLLTGGYDGRIHIWDVQSRKRVGTLAGAQGTIWSLSVSPDGGRVAAAGEDKIIRIWNIADGKLLRRLAGHERNIWEVRFSPDGKRLASGSFDNRVRLWDADTGALLRTLTEHEQAVVGLAWSRDGRYLATGGDDSVIFIRRGSDGAPVRKLAVGNHVYKLAFSADGQWLASSGRARSGLGTFWHQATGLGGDARPIRLWRVGDGALVAALDLPDDAMSVAFGPNGQWLASAGEDSQVNVWRLRLGGTPQEPGR